MLVKVKHILTRKIVEKELPITQEQFDNWNNGMLIQEAFPNLNADDREFLITGLSPEEWEEIFKE